VNILANERILIADDEQELVEIMTDYLKAEGFEVLTSFDGEEALKSFDRFGPQLVLLDVMMPKLDGMEVCRLIRARTDVPVLMLSAKSGDIDKILALGLGADDYITKPFSPGELVARVKAQLRRYLRLSFQPPQPSILRYSKLEIDSRAYTVRLGGKIIDLTAKEFELLNFMASNPMQVFSREQLFNKIWGFSEFGDINTVTVHIRKIREKIESDPSNPVFIKTVWSVGYKFDGGAYEAKN
jgi:two-component system response regulator VicR